MRAHAETQEDRRSRRAPRPVSPATSAPSTALTPGALTGLQRSAGNAAVSRMLDGRAKPVQRMENDAYQTQQAVLSGHGRFGDNQLLPANPSNPRSRQLKPTFTVPEGVELVVYAPPGAWLENEVAKRIESYAPPMADELEMVGPNNKRRAMPAAYPKTFHPGEEVINYKLMPLEAQHLAEGATSVGYGTLQEKVYELAYEAAGAPLTIHYACCGVGSSNHKAVDDLFKYRNYTVMLRTVPEPEPAPASSSKRRRKK